MNIEKLKDDLAGLVEEYFPKHECKERGQAIVLIARATMILMDVAEENKELRRRLKNAERRECELVNTKRINESDIAYIITMQSAYWDDLKDKSEYPGGYPQCIAQEICSYIEKQYIL